MTLIFVFNVSNLLKKMDVLQVNSEQWKSSFKMSAVETWHEAEAWNTFLNYILDSGQYVVLTHHLEISISPAWLHKGD